MLADADMSPEQSHHLVSDARGSNDSAAEPAGLVAPVHRVKRRVTVPIAGNSTMRSQAGESRTALDIPLTTGMT